MGRGKGGPYHRANWPEEMTPSELLRWASQRVGSLLGDYAGALVEQDFEGARARARQVVDLAYLLDTFARQEKTRWLHRQASSPKP